MFRFLFGFCIQVPRMCSTSTSNLRILLKPVQSSIIFNNILFAVFDKSVTKVGHAGNPSRVLGWTSVGDRSVRPNSWPVPMPYWCHPDDHLDLKSYPQAASLYT